MPTPTPTIPLKTYRFQFNSDQLCRSPRYSGSAWRGAFGQALKKTVCVVRNTPCGQCLLRDACAYTYIFETPPPPNTEKMRKYNAVPHPFVFKFPQEPTAREYGFNLELVIFGHGQRYFPYFVHALKKAGEDGIGGHRQVFRLAQVDEIGLDGGGTRIYRDGSLLPQQPATSPALPGNLPQTINIALHTPLRIKQDGKNLTPREFNFAAFFGNLLRRVSLISYFHTDSPLEVNFAALSQKAKTIAITQKQLDWFDWTRYSSRQETEMQMGGIVGTFQLETNDIHEFWPYLWLGQWTHVGKGTSMGMGAYTINLQACEPTGTGQIGAS